MRLFADYLFGGYDLFETRGLGPWAAPQDIDFSISMSSDQRNDLVVEPGVGVNWYSDGGMAYELEFETDWNVSSRLTLTGEVGVEWERGVSAWSSNESFRFHDDQWHIGTRRVPPSEINPEDFLTFEGAQLLESLLENVSPYNAAGDYYLPVFGERDTRFIDFTLRSNFTLSPTLSFRFYGQLFLAKGRYENFGLLRAPDDMVAFDVFPKRDDFTLNSFQTNAVLRWEYFPGSNIYLVWSQGRRQDVRVNPLAPTDPSFYEQDVSSQISETFRIFPNNAFMFKLDYTFLN